MNGIIYGGVNGEVRLVVSVCAQNGEYRHQENENAIFPDGFLMFPNGFFGVSKWLFDVSKRQKQTSKVDFRGFKLVLTVIL